MVDYRYISTRYYPNTGLPPIATTTFLIGWQLEYGGQQSR